MKNITYEVLPERTKKIIRLKPSVPILECWLKNIARNKSIKFLSILKMSVDRINRNKARTSSQINKIKCKHVHVYNRQIETF